MNPVHGLELQNFIPSRPVTAAGSRRSLYVYSPFCGSCRLAEQMLTLLEQSYPQLAIASVNVLDAAELVQAHRIESVPCLLLWGEDTTERESGPEKIYAFHSVTYMYERLKGGGLL
ncbi:thioredoxin family protein [Paenibacillus thiaminolyticus]|uniref:thioredoxin family protein n=1 Tax=Paenibacillus thiaminolyticus TaxID=49283 RepID=UPI003D2B3F1F